MKQFRILYFSESVLVRAEEVEAFDVLEVIETASAKPADQRVEVWCDRKRVGEIGVSPSVSA